MIRFGLLFTVLVETSLGQLFPISDMLLRMYAQNGLPFREDVFLDNRPISDEYDFVIIGASPSGSVIANRLTENPEWKVLLLDAGIEGSLYTDIPALNTMFFFTDYNWHYKTEPQPDLACRGSEGGVCSWPSGRGVGGMTIWNGLMWTRCPASDFDEWEAMGNPGWGFSDILKYYLKVEKMHIPSLQSSPYHSTTGKVGVDYGYVTKLLRRFIDAGKEMGYKEVDYNNPKTPLGFSRTQTTVSKGKRVNAATAYLYPIKDRSNFHIVKNAHVNKIIIDPVTKEAKAVEFLKNGKVRTVKATKEIILSAGTFHSPKILMLSGVGPAEHLKSKNVPVVHNLPSVGKNLQEHVAGSITVHINASESLTAQKVAPMLVPALVEWLRYGTGLLTDNIAEGVGYVRTQPNRTKPDIELILTPVTLAADDGLVVAKYFGMAQETFDKSFPKEVSQKEGFTLGAMLMYPESKGSVSLRTNDPMDPPEIIANFLKDPRDVQTAVAGIRFAEELIKKRPFREIGATVYKKPVFGCEHTRLGTDEYRECSVRTITGQLHHQCCTNRMGPNSKESVVDPRLRVHGIKKLRVADASVMPKIPGAHTMAISYAIGEKASDLIKEDWNLLRPKR